MIENITIPIVLNDKNCQIRVQRTLFSNDEDTITVVWHGDDGEEIEHCYNYDLPVSDQKFILNAIEEYDKKMVKRGL